MDSTFHITETPTLHFVATEDEQQLSQDLQARLEESLAQALEQPDVVAAGAAHQEAKIRLEQLKKAESTLHRYAREASEEMSRAAETALDRIIETASEGRPDFAAIGAMGEIETRHKQTGRALERLVEHLIPLAQIVELRRDSHELMTRARAMEQIAQERAERLLSQLRSAVSEEVVLPVDMSKGVTGALLAHASGLKKLAVRQSESADRIEKSYTMREGGKK
jgi:response regulator RpfG family c-di-GMP phosphodiesterase